MPEITLMLKFADQPLEAFRRLELPVHFTLCWIEGGAIWAAWGLN